MKKKIGLALSSGGSRGFVQIGVIKALIENNIPVHYVAGTSMGSVIAGYYALYNEISNLEKIVCALKKKDMLSFIDLNDPRKSLIKGEKMKSFLKPIFGDKTFSDTIIPLRIGATSLQTGEAVVFSSGKILDAIMASSAFPGVFPAVRYKGHDLVDGAIAEVIPAKIVKDMGADAIIAVDLFYIKPNMKIKYTNIGSIMDRTIELLQSKLSDYNILEYGKNTIVLRPDTGKRLQTFAFYDGKKKIHKGYIEAKKNMQKIKRIVK